jgi:uncharacterized protein (TIGR02145 family)
VKGALKGVSSIIFDPKGEISRNTAPSAESQRIQGKTTIHFFQRATLSKSHRMQGVSWIVFAAKMLIHRMKGESDIVFSTSATLSGYKLRGIASFSFSAIINTMKLVKYGLLYNWYAATDARNIASEGWHVPTKDEFTTLVNYLIAGGYGYGGEEDYIAKSVASCLFWDTSIVLGSPGLDPAENNSSGFNLPPAGGRDSNGSFNPVTMRPAGKGAGIWTSTEFPTSVAFYFEIVYNDVYFHSVINSKRCGLSIRPIKDSTSLSHGQSGTYTGNDGKQYRSICIGTQELVSENLCETEFRNGNTIPEVTDSAAWASMTTAAMCAPDNDWDNVFI